PLVRDLAVPAPADADLFNKARAEQAKLRKGLVSPQRCIDAVEVATQMDLDAGIDRELEIFKDIMVGPQAKAMQHAFFGERAASKIPDVPDSTPVRKVEKVAVIGAGTMGGGITMCFLNAGIPVTLLEMKQDAIDRGVGTIRKNYEAQVAKGKLAQDKYEARMALLTTTLSYDDIAQADMVIEAVFENFEVKSQVFTKLDAVMKPGAILASNTSTLDVDKIAEVTQRPADVVGLHFFSPANVMRLLEVVRSKHTAKDVMATVMQVAKKIKKVAVVSGVCDGFIGNRMFEQYTRQAFFLVQEGATVQRVDKAAEAFGFAMGPFRVGDLAGNDIGFAIRQRRAVEQPNVIYSKVGDAICELGRFGQKVGKGWYDYEAGKREPVPSAEVQACIDKVRADKGITARAISDEEIVGRLVLAMVNEGAQILEEGIANKASDIDMVYLTGYGFPLVWGGPMLYADLMGLPKVVDAMKQYQANPHDDQAFWTPAPLLLKLAQEGKTFTGVNL
nr:3-hydroxyacyl-CoA dehydrogenase [Aquabacterium sp.]